MIFCDISRAVIISIIPISYLLFHSNNNIVLIVIGILVTSLRAFFYPAFQSSIPQLVNNDDELHKVNALMNTTDGLSLILGPALGSITFIFTKNIQILLFITIITFVISAFSILRINDALSSKSIDKHNSSLLKDSTLGLVYIIKKNKLVLFMLIAFTTQLLIVVGIINIALPKSIESINLSKESIFGYCTALISLGSIIMSAVMAKIKIKDHSKWVVYSYYIRGFVFALFFLVQFLGISWIFINSFLLGASFALSGPTLTTLLQSNTAKESHGKVLSLRSTLGNVTDSFSYILIGLLITTLTLNVTYILSASMILIVTIILHILMTKNNIFIK